MHSVHEGGWAALVCQLVIVVSLKHQVLEMLSSDKVPRLILIAKCVNEPCTCASYQPCHMTVNLTTTSGRPLPLWGSRVERRASRTYQNPGKHTPDPLVAWLVSGGIVQETVPPKSPASRSRSSNARAETSCLGAVDCHYLDPKSMHNNGLLGYAYGGLGR